MIATPADKFSRLSALKPARGAGAFPARNAEARDAAGAAHGAEMREPCEEDTLARLLGARVGRNRFGEHLAVRNWYSSPEFVAPSPVALDILSRRRDERPARRVREETPSQRGNNQTQSRRIRDEARSRRARNEAQQRARDETRRAREALSDPAKWLFLDTETTGLAGGTGTYAFLIGLAWWDAGGLQVEQLFMRDFGEEHAILHELAARVAERPVLITYNGKTFDWPLLESRFTMTRSIAAPKLLAHLDLLHPARAVWKLRLGSVRLSDLERHVLEPVALGWNRDEDTTSALIPQYYFDYLRGGPPEPLLGIAKHNQMDLRGLAALYCKLNALLGDETRAHGSVDGRDLFGLSRYLQRRGHGQRAEAACTQALDFGLPFEVRPQARRDLAQHAKRRGEHERAAEIWQEMVSGEPGEIVHACEQLAMHYERRLKDCARALEFARLALAELQKAQRLATRMPAGHFAGAFAGAMTLQRGSLHGGRKQRDGSQRDGLQGDSYQGSGQRASRLEKDLRKRVARLERRLLAEGRTPTLGLVPGLAP